MKLHDKILNIKPREFRFDLPKSSFAAAYKEGHDEALHAAASLAFEADELNQKHRDLLQVFADDICDNTYTRAARAALLSGDDAALKSTV